MKMIKRLLILTIFIVITGCNNTPEPFVAIIAEKDTVQSEEMYLAKIYLRNYFNHEIIPEFFIFYNNDTTYIEVDEKEFCGIYRATHATADEFEINGMVRYTDDDKVYTINYTIEYIIK